MKVCVIGLGYIGLPTSLLIASKGINVFGVDKNKKVIDSLQQEKTHINEAKVQEMLTSAYRKKTLSVDLVLSEADVFIITVPTPFKSGFEPDLSMVMEAAENISKKLKKGDLILIESTCPVGSTHKVMEKLLSLREDLFSKKNNLESAKFSLAYCPERVLPGNIIFELENNDRVVGGFNSDSSKKAKAFYEKFVKGSIRVTDSSTAELCKLTENAFRDVSIAFANELSMISKEMNIDVWELIELCNLHPRVNILSPGPGVGGHCIKVDPWFIVDSVPEIARLIKLSREINDSMPGIKFKELNSLIKNSNENPTNLNLACLGITFKADVDDIRESPAIEFVNLARKLNFKSIEIVEPNLDSLPEELKYEDISLKTLESAIKNCEVIVLLVDHKEFFEIEKSKLSHKLVLDTKGVWKEKR